MEKVASAVGEQDNLNLMKEYDISENNVTPSIGATVVADHPADDNCNDGRIGIMSVQPCSQVLVSWTDKCSAPACSDNTVAGSVERRFEPIFLLISR